MLRPALGRHRRRYATERQRPYLPDHPVRRVTALLLVLALAAPAAARGDTATFTPTADARVEVGKPSANLGSNRWLKAGASPKTRSYLRFDVALLAGSTVTRATLRLYATRSSAGAGYQAYPVSESNWQESSITCNSRPAISATAIGSSGGWSGTGYEAAALAAGSIEPGVQTIAVQTTRNSSQSFESREGARDPQLVVTHAPPAWPISTPGNQPSPAPAWSDEFNGAAGTPPDPASWTVRTGGKWMSGGSPELQCYTTRPREREPRRARASSDHRALRAGQQLLLGHYERLHIGSDRLERQARVPIRPHRGANRAAGRQRHLARMVDARFRLLLHDFLASAGRRIGTSTASEGPKTASNSRSTAGRAGRSRGPTCRRVDCGRSTGPSSCS